MTTQNAPADTSAAAITATSTRPVPVPAPPSWAWRRGALILAGAAQLITISALTSADPLAVTWASLLLAIAPAPLAAAAAFAPAPVNRLAAVIAVLVLVADAAGGIVHTGLFFVPALVVLAVGSVKLWREQPGARREVVLAMARYLTRDRIAVVAALTAPLAVAAILLPFRASWSNTNVALLLVVVVVGWRWPGTGWLAGWPRCGRLPGLISSSPCRTTGSRSAAGPMSRLPSCCCSLAWWCRSSRPGPGG
jgi:hypothetical protein